MVKVFFDVSIDGRLLGRIKIQLFVNKCPRSSENFRQLCTGEFRKDGRPTGYLNAPFHRVTDFCVQGGDFVRQDGSGSLSIYGITFPDENLGSISLDSEGLVAMANQGPNTNGCQFFITLKPCPWLSGKHVVVGKVVDGMDIVRGLGRVTVDNEGRPRRLISITQCGEL